MRSWRVDMFLSSVAKFLSLFEKCNFFFPECATYFTMVAFNYHNVKLCKINADDTLKHVLQFVIDLNI